jgi:hypothetical protein
MAGVIFRQNRRTVQREPSERLPSHPIEGHLRASSPVSSAPPMVGLWSNRHVLETPEEIDRLLELLDRSAAGAGAHMSSIISDERRLSAVRVCEERLQGMRLLVVATVTADGRPLAGPVDGYFLHGFFYFSSGRDSVRMRHLAARPESTPLTSRARNSP